MDLQFDRKDSVTPPGGPEIVYRVLGRGPTLVLLHGGSGSYRHWIRNVGTLAQTFKTIVPDLPGFGDSGDVAADISLEAYVSLVADGLDIICPAGEPLQLAGFSFGGMICAGLAAGLQGRVLRLTLLAPGGMGRPAPDAPAIGLLKARPGMDEQEILSIHRRNLEAMMIADPTHIDQQTVDLHRANIERARFRNWGLSWTDSVVEFLADIQFPAQFLIGERDAVARPSVAHRLERVKKAKADIETHIVPGAGHWAQYEAPEAVNDLLIRFHDIAGA